jgi:D-proline reductase (dithiol) PrdB
MGNMDEFSLPVRMFLKAYPWRKIDPVPWTPLKRPLSQCKLGLITTAGFTAPNQQPFDASIKGGDVSFRVIENDTKLELLHENHRSYSFDHAGINADANLAFPIFRAHELVERGTIGSVNHRHLSFMGSIVAPGRLRAQTAPEAARIFVEDQVDIALLTPV